MTNINFRKILSDENMQIRVVNWVKYEIRSNFGKLIVGKRFKLQWSNIFLTYHIFGSDVFIIF